ncbi:LysR family transcriptional regulator [Virgibacillus halophilus]|uniref:LysR family transcriptional regulator n=1 Tax=Tigheibacillus halophilus TaxID=361280 RepID=A0ABU5C4J1_9BACI|nr:LysR family transcriptional regulator [Virgibacillus halophilus]
MDIKQLSYFAAIVENKSFTKAAEQLHISQPSLSAAIKKLEDEVGLILIDRSAKILRITNEGEIVYSEAIKLLKHFESVTGGIFPSERKWAA